MQRDKADASRGAILITYVEQGWNSGHIMIKIRLSQELSAPFTDKT